MPVCTPSSLSLSLCLWALPFAAAQAASSVTLTSAAGDPVGQGQSHSYVAPTADISVTGPVAGQINVVVSQDGNWWSIELAAPRETEVARGNYPSAERAVARTGRAPGVEVLSNGVGCEQDVWGSFALRQLAYDEFGHLTSLEATFVQRCGSATAPALTGTVIYNAAPLYFRYTSPAGEPLGGGVGQTLYGHTSDMALDGTSAGLSYAASGLRKDFYLAISPPEGQVLARGVYPIQRSNDASHAGIYLTDQNVVCDTLDGSLNIKSVRFDGLGQVTGLYAVLTAYCNGAEQPFTATLRHRL